MKDEIPNLKGYDKALRDEAAEPTLEVPQGEPTSKTQIIAIYGKGGIGKSFTLANLSHMMAEMGKRASVAVSFIGKVKTGAQMWAILLMLYSPPGETISNVGIALLYLASVLTLWSMAIYLKAAWPDLSEEMYIK